MRIDGLRGRIARASRMAVFGACLSVGLSAIAARHARAEVLEATGTSSSVLAQLAELPELGGGLTRLDVNGESVHVAAAVVPKAMPDVVRDIEKSCWAGVEGMADANAHANANGTARRFDLGEAVLEAARSLTSREGDTTTVVCVAESDATRGVALRDRLTAFARTRDLAALGSLRHFTITPNKAGTRVIASWLPARFPLDRAFPETGDAPGADADGVPRPAGARRLLTAGAEGHPNVVRIYELADAHLRADVVARQYAEALARAGWQPHDGVAERMPRNAVIYRLGERDLLVQIRSDERAGRVFVSTIDMRAVRAEN